MQEIPQTLERKIKHFMDAAGYKSAEEVLRAALKALEEKQVKTPAVDPERLQRRKEAIHMQVIEENPLDEKDIALLEMFDRKGWSDQQRIDYITRSAKDGRLFDR